jgi:cell division septation protein DedD
MGKDFAQRGSGGRQATHGRSMPGWVWMFVGIALGAAGVAAYYVTRPARATADVAVDTLDDHGKAGAHKKITIPPKQPSRFAFYELLPNYEVVVPKDSVKSGQKPQQPALAQPGEYLIQVGSFQTRKEADQQKAKLALLGVESRIEQVTIDNQRNWFRVRIGPERDADKVQQLVSRLEENQIEALVIRVPD